jgi:hypothetical protein
MSRRALITLLLPALCLLAATAPALASATALASGLAAHRGGPGRVRHAFASGPGAARWACPTGRCEAIVLARAHQVADGWRTADAAGPLLQGGGEHGGFDPSDLQSAYHIPTTLSSPQTIALIDAYGYPDAESDLAAYRKRYGLPACTKAEGCFRKVNGSGEEGNYPPTEAEAGWGEEAALDADMASAACPQCDILMVETPNEGVEALSQGDATAAALGATEISNSWGEAEAHCGESCKLYERDFEQHGVLITAAGGDEGYEGIYTTGRERKPVSPEFPADLPEVVSVGGTALYKDSGVARGWREEVWNQPRYTSNSSVGTGSGCSSYLKVPKPSWQAEGGCAYRADNDVAAVASAATPVSVRFDGAWELEGGTSVSAPLLAAIEAHASAYVRSLGPQAFYEDPSSLNEVTEGFNYYPGASPCAPLEYLCNAESGYDGPTGLGTPEGVPGLPDLAPEVTLATPGELTATSVKLQGSVNPQGSLVSECKFEYGTSKAYGKSIACSPAPGSGGALVAVAGSLAALKAATTYDYRLSATNPVGATKSINATFTTPRLPVVVLYSASAVTAGSALLHGSVNPEGLTLTECSFEYGTSTAYGNSVACATTPTGTKAVAVSAPLAGLKAATTYDFRLTARSSAGSARSVTAALKTLRGP